MLDKARLPDIHRANMTLLRSLTLRCQGCDAKGKGADHWAMRTPKDMEAAKRFLSGSDDGAGGSGLSEGLATDAEQVHIVAMAIKPPGPTS